MAARNGVVSEVRSTSTTNLSFPDVQLRIWGALLREPGSMIPAGDVDSGPAPLAGHRRPSPTKGASRNDE